MYFFTDDPTEDEEENESVPYGPFRSWKIVCQEGQWNGISLGCDSAGLALMNDDGLAFSASDSSGNRADASGSSARSSFNASCPFRAPKLESNLVAFYGDRELRESVTIVENDDSEFTSDFF